ncbi:MAG: DUF115 domain-containing protein [Spirochaetaceae bacterium]|jgi:hypothetical protein|nr:DUF115 domain-containing protein [Spirochaetaceae bacterium]
MSDELPRQREARRGFSVCYRGKTLLSVVDPINQAERIAGSIEKLSRTLYFCPSPLYGYGLTRLLSGISPDSAVLCVETDERLMALSLEAMEGLLRENPQLRLVRTADPAGLCACVREFWGSRRFRRVVTARLSGGWQLDGERYQALADALSRDIASDWSNAMTLLKLGRRYIRNAIRNLSLIPRVPDISRVDFGGAPILVPGAGPSLDGILEGLSAAFGDLSNPAERPFRIICVDTALRALRERNIKPDLTVALESQHWNLRDFIGLGDWTIPLAMDLSALPATAAVPGAEPFLFFTPWAPLSLFDRLEQAKFLPKTLAPLGSVGLTAVALALRLGSGPVVTGGIDFSFTPDGFHARATPGGLESLHRNTRFQSLINAGQTFRRGSVSTRSKTGVPVRTDPAMKGYRDLFEREFAGENSGAGGPRLLSITGSGLPLGIPAVEGEEAWAILAGGPGEDGPSGNGPETRWSVPAGDRAQLRGAVELFVREERETLITLRGILKGEIAPGQGELEKLLDTADYLWAHFPDCAGAGGRRPPGTDTSFLKRVRVELDPCIALYDLVLAELAEPAPGGTHLS